MERLLYVIVLVTSFSYGQEPLIIAHRGGAGTAPENTLAAFHKAVEVNADYFELDVMISSDDSLMIMHDATVDRTTDGSGNVASLTYEQLRTLDAGSWFNTEFTGEKIPTLWESLMVARNSPNDIGVVIEIKSSDPSVPSKIVNLVQQSEMESRVIVSSFSLGQITEVKSLDASIAVQLFGTITETNIDQVAAINGEWVGSGGTLSKDLIDYAHMQGLLFNAWTLNAASTILPAIELGVDAITTDFPVLMLALMDETAPTDVVLTSATPSETRVILNWEPATDEESGIAGYDIFRDEAPGATSLLVSTGNVTEYVDDTYTESKEYYYRIKARNLAGMSSMNFSNEIAVTTLSDITPPVLQSITSRGKNNTVVIGFSERVDQATAETPTNYMLNYGAAVESSILARDQKSVMLTTSPLSQQAYLLTVRNVQDRADTPNSMITDTKIFLHYDIPEDAAAFYTLDSLPLVNTDHRAIDETENQNNGTIKNGAYPTQGILGNGIGFDGVDDYVEFKASESFDINGSAVSLSLWTKLPHKPSELPGPYAPLFDSETDNYVLYVDRGNNELRFKVVTSGGAERPGIPGADIKTGEWIHVVGVYNGAQAMIYLNGVLKDSHSISGMVKTGQIATLGRTGSTYLEGSIDQVEVYSRALSEEEIMMIHKIYMKEAVFECESFDITEDVIICSGDSYTFPDGTVAAENTVHISELPTLYDCSSIITTNLEVIDLDVSVSLDNGVITAGLSGALYRWLDCDNGYAEIADESGRSFTPSAAGNYAAEITMGECTDTSECIYTEPVSVDLLPSMIFTVYPNPNRGTFTLEFDGPVNHEMKLEIINASGKRVYEEVIIDQGGHLVDLPVSQPGIYMIRVYSNEGSTEKQIMIL